MMVKSLIVNHLVRLELTMEGEVKHLTIAGACRRWGGLTRTLLRCSPPPLPIEREREFLIANPQVRIHLIIEMMLVDRPCAMGD